MVLARPCVVSEGQYVIQSMSSTLGSWLSWTLPAARWIIIVATAGCRLVTRDRAMSSRPPLDHASLPKPLDYLHREGFRYDRPRGEWISVCCPVHKNGAERSPSLSVNTKSGGFKCHACGVKGGDIVDLHQLKTGLGFREAVFDLGGSFHD
jgi:hypothetical protein